MNHCTFKSTKSAIECKRMGTRFKVLLYQKTSKWKKECLSSKQNIWNPHNKLSKNPHINLNFERFDIVFAWGFQWKLALDLLSQMKKDKVEPDVISYSSAISALSKGKCWLEAINLLSEMKAHGVTLLFTNWKILFELKPNVIVYNSCISACANGHESEVAIRLLKEMKLNGLQPNEVSYNSAISASNDFYKAMGLFNEMKANNIPPSVVTYTSLMKVLVSVNHLDDGFLLLEELYQDLELTKKSYPTHYVLLTACRNVEDDRANKLQSKIIKLQLQPPRAEISFMINNKEHR